MSSANPHERDGRPTRQEWVRANFTQIFGVSAESLRAQGIDPRRYARDHRDQIRRFAADATPPGNPRRGTFGQWRTGRQRTHWRGPRLSGVWPSGSVRTGGSGWHRLDRGPGGVVRLAVSHRRLICRAACRRPLDTRDRRDHAGGPCAALFLAPQPACQTPSVGWSERRSLGPVSGGQGRMARRITSDPEPRSWTEEPGLCPRSEKVDHV